MRARPAVVTELPISPEQDQRARIIRYMVIMAIRVACIGLCFAVPGWWVVIPALGAVFLPWFAVVVANAASRKDRGQVERPGAIRRRDTA